jgi:hypothetical protein
MSDVGVTLDTLPSDHDHPDTALERALYVMKHPVFRAEPLMEPHTPRDICGDAPDPRQYDALLEGSLRERETGGGL